MDDNCHLITVTFFLIIEWITLVISSLRPYVLMNNIIRFSTTFFLISYLSHSLTEDVLYPLLVLTRFTSLSTHRQNFFSVSNASNESSSWIPLNAEDKSEKQVFLEHFSSTNLNVCEVVSFSYFLKSIYRDN